MNFWRRKIVEEFDEKEAFERQLMELGAGKLKFEELDALTQKRLKAYVSEKRKWQREQWTQIESEMEARLSSHDPKVRCLRRVKLEPTEFEKGTRVRDYYENVEPARATFEPLQEAFLEALGNSRKAEAELKNYDPDSTSEFEYRDRVARLDFWRRKLKVVGPKARMARQEFNAAETTFKLEYATYVRRLDEINSLGVVSRPLAAHETIEERAREAGEISRLDYIIQAMLKPTSIAKSSAA
jgi:hypothetical protein